MKIQIDEKVNRKFKKIKSTNLKLARLIEKQLALFSENPKHPSLRTHKITQAEQDSWSISINMSIRMTYILLEDEIALFVKIGTHEEVYKKRN